MRYNGNMENASLTPTQTLRAEWLTMVRALILTDGAMDVAANWLVRNPDYDPQTFWTAPGKDGYVALSEAFVHGKHEDYVLPKLLPYIKKHAPQQAFKDQFNQPGEDGKVLLHLMWNKHQQQIRAQTSNSSGAGRELSQQLLMVFDVTDPKHWTFLDKATDEPGGGLRRVVMDMLSRRPNDYTATMANGVMDRLAKVYPARPPQTSPEDSPWRGALTPAQVEALATLGHRLDEPVAVGQLQVPAWEWLFLQSARTDTYRKTINKLLEDQGLMDTVQSWKEARTAEIEQSGRPSWNSISPTDRRATSGYVASVLKFANKDKTPCFDTYGRSPLDYLLDHRSDLFGMFATKASSMDTQEFQAKFMQPDRAGVPAILRYIQKVPEGDQKTLEGLLRRHDCWTAPADLLRERGGLLAWEQDLSGWTESHSRYTSDTLALRLPADLADPEVVFGPAQQQAKWRQMWEENFSRWPAMREWLKKTKPYEAENRGPLVSLPPDMRFSRQAVQQIKLFLANGSSPQWKEKLDPDLYATLHMAACAITSGLGDDPKHNWFAGLNKLSHELATTPPGPSQYSSYSYSRSSPADRWGVTLSRNPPEHSTSFLLAALDTPAGAKVLASLDNGKDLPGRHWSWRNTEEIETCWGAWFKRAQLMQSVTPAARSEDRMRM